MDTPKIALAPKLVLLSVPSSLSIISSIPFWSMGSTLALTWKKISWNRESKFPKFPHCEIGTYQCWSNDFIDIVDGFGDTLAMPLSLVLIPEFKSFINTWKKNYVKSSFIKVKNKFRPSLDLLALKVVILNLGCFHHGKKYFFFLCNERSQTKVFSKWILTGLFGQKAKMWCKVSKQQKFRKKLRFHIFFPYDVRKVTLVWLSKLQFHHNNVKISEIFCHFHILREIKLNPILQINFT